VNQKIKAITVDGVECTTELILSGKYPLVRPIYFLTLDKLSPAARGFIDYVLGPAGQASIVADGLLPAK